MHLVLLIFPYFRYFAVAQKASLQSQREAIEEETTFYVDEEIEVEDEDGMPLSIFRQPEIDVETDARHGWRKNSKDTSVVALGKETHKVIGHEHITKEDDSVSQRHELLGTKRLYDHFEKEGVGIRVHAHDRNQSINKFIRETTTATNQNDIWHGIKSLKKSVSKIVSGPQYKEGQAWHQELKDKLEPMCTHAHWAARNCDGNSNKLRASLLNSVAHFKNYHSECPEISRCKTDPHHENSNIIITSPIAEKLLTDAIMKSDLYKHADDFNLAQDTFHTESFNNTMNIFHDKRVAFGKQQYALRSHLAILHWNENVGREHTSILSTPRAKSPRSQKGKRILVSARYNYREKLWKNFVAENYLTPPS